MSRSKAIASSARPALGSARTPTSVGVDFFHFPRCVVQVDQFGAGVQEWLTDVQERRENIGAHGQDHVGNRRKPGGQRNC